MTIATVCAGIQTLLNNQVYVVGSDTYTIHAFDEPQNNAPDTAQMPACYPKTGRAVYDYESLGDDFVSEFREYIVNFLIMPHGEATPELIEIRCRPAIVEPDRAWRSS